MAMVQLHKDMVTGLKRRNRHVKPFYKSKLACGLATIFFIGIGIWYTSPTSTGSKEETSSILSKVLFSSESRNTGTSTLQLFSTPECQKKTGRWSERFPSRTKSKVQSIFNCDNPNPNSNATSCQYYFPGNFFDEDCGIGGAFAHYVSAAEEMRRNGTLWINMPSVGFPTLTMDKTCLNIEDSALNPSPPRKAELEKRRRATSGKKKRKGAERKRRLKSKVGFEDRRFGGGERNSPSVLYDIGEHFLPSEGQRCLTERVSFIHVHKSGGTSLHRAFDVMNNRMDTTTLTRHKWFTPKKSVSAHMGTKVVGGMPSVTAERMYNFTLESTLQATTYPATKFGEYDHTIFAVVRDPTERFISSIGQAMGGEGSQRNMIGKTLQKECIKSTSALTLACMARYVRDHSFWIELHFAPQVIDISFTTIWQDIPIAIFPFKELKNILKYLNLPNVQGRNGDRSGYRPNPVLSEMSVEDYDDETLKIVCEIYEVDVTMQRSLGIEVPRCDPFISRQE